MLNKLFINIYIFHLLIFFSYVNANEPVDIWSIDKKKDSNISVIPNIEDKNKILTPDLLNEESPKFLHRFSWLEDNEIGSLPLAYNWLVGWYKEPNDGTPKILHYTEGGPWFDGYRDCEYGDDWKKELINLFSS